MANSGMKNTIQGAVYHTLKQGIITMKLVPGTVMSTQEMATHLNVSRTPVREAFIRLQEEGLVDVIPQRETMVSRIDLKRVEEERFIRESLELAIIQPFLQKCNAEHFMLLREYIEEQKKCYFEKNYADFVYCDNQFHKLFFEVAEHNLAWDTLINVNGHYNRIRILTVQNDDTIVSTIRQHDRIVTMMEQGADNDMVRAELANHVKKINYEKTELIKQYPDYFVTREATSGVEIAFL